MTLKEIQKKDLLEFMDKDFLIELDRNNFFKEKLQYGDLTILIKGALNIFGYYGKNKLYFKTKLLGNNKSYFKISSELYHLINFK